MTEAPADAGQRTSLSNGPAGPPEGAQDDRTALIPNENEPSNAALSKERAGRRESRAGFDPTGMGGLTPEQLALVEEARKAFEDPNALNLKPERARTSFGLKNKALADFVESRTFEAISAAPIVALIVIVTWSAAVKPEDRTQSEIDATLIVEHILLGLFVLEWLLRLALFGSGAFLDTFDKIDFCLVFGCGVGLMWILAPAIPDASDFRVATTLRSARVVRVVRILRTMPWAKELVLLVRGVLASFKTLMSSMALFVMVLFFFAIIGVELVGRDDPINAGCENSTTEDCENRNAARVHQEMMSTLGGCMFILLRFAFSDDAASIVEEMMNGGFGAIWIYWILFVGIVVFVLLNMITAVIVENAFAIVKSDEAYQAELARAEQKETLRKLEEMFARLDNDGSGEMDFAEFAGMFKNDEARVMLAALEFTPDDLIELYTTLDDDGGGCLSLEEFKMGMSRLKGEAKARDMLSVLKGLQRLERKLEGRAPTPSTSSGADSAVLAHLEKLSEQVATLTRRLDGVSAAKSSTAKVKDAKDGSVVKPKKVLQKKETTTFGAGTQDTQSTAATKEADVPEGDADEVEAAEPAEEKKEKKKVKKPAKKPAKV